MTNINFACDAQGGSVGLVSVAELATLRARSARRGPDQEAAMLAFAEAMVGRSLARDEILSELAEAHWPEDGSRPPPAGGEPAHRELMARLEAHVSAAMSRKAFAIARQYFAEFVARDGRPNDGAPPFWEVERATEAVAWGVDFRTAAAVLRALKQAAAIEGLEVAFSGGRYAISRARIAHDEWWSGRPYFFSEESEAGRACRDAWELAFGEAEALFGEGEALPVVAGKVAATVAALDVEGVADAVVTAAHLAGITVHESAYAAAEGAATAARWGTNSESARSLKSPYLTALDAAPSVLANTSSADLAAALIERFAITVTEAEEIAAAVVADVEAKGEGLRAYLARLEAGRGEARAPAAAAAVEVLDATRASKTTESPPAASRIAAVAVASGPRELAFDLATEPGLLGDIARWYLAMAFRPIDSFAPFAALATVAPVFGRRYATPTGQGLNLYMVALAETGAGKEALLKAPQSALDAANLDWLLGAVDFTSDSALEVALRNRPNFLAPIDEVGEFIGGAQHKQAAPHSRTLRKALLDLYGKSEVGSRWSGKQKADADFDKASCPIYCPTLTILGCATPEGFYASLTEGNMADGFMNRLTVVRGSRPGPPNLDPARFSVPTAIVEGLRAAYEAGQAARGNLEPAAARTATTRVSPAVVPWANEAARSAWMAVLHWEISANDGGRGGVTARASSQALKIATLRALSRDPADPAVSADDVAWGWSFVKASIAEVERGAAENMAGSEHEALAKAVERAVSKAGPNGITRSELNRAAGVSKATPAQRKAALDDLMETGRAHRAIANPLGGGRPSERIKLGRAPGTE